MGTPPENETQPTASCPPGLVLELHLLGVPLAGDQKWAEHLQGCERCAEILVEEARAHLEEGGSVEEIRFVLFGEPTYRVFEMVDDAAKVAAQMKRLEKR